VPAEVRLYDRLFLNEDPSVAAEGRDFLDNLNPNSLDALSGAMVEPSLKNIIPGDKIQFERQGYFCADPDSTKEKPVFNRTVTLKDAWVKIEKSKKKE
jgi:glutaminyl-tRNA synthetase